MSTAERPIAVVSACGGGDMELALLRCFFLRCLGPEAASAWDLFSVSVSRPLWNEPLWTDPLAEAEEES